MKIILPTKIVQQLRYSMFFAGRREIGGILMAEDLGNQSFRVSDISIDMNSGTYCSFFRNAIEHDQALAKFHEINAGQHNRYNYLGERHTHPSFTVQPSLQDLEAMADLVDGGGGVDFAVLLIARIKWFCKFECSAQLFVKGHSSPFPVEVILESPD